MEQGLAGNQEKKNNSLIAIYNFKKEYFEKTVVYISSVTFIYAQINLLFCHFRDLSDKYLYFQILSFLFGIINGYLTKWYSESLEIKRMPTLIKVISFILLLFFLSTIFTILYNVLNSDNLTLGSSYSQFIWFAIPVIIYTIFYYITS